MDLASLLFPSLAQGTGTDDGSSADGGGGWTSGWFGGLFGPKTRSGERVTPATALTLSTYFACLRNVSEDIGKLPLVVYRETNRGRQRVTTDPLYRLLHDAPSDEMTSMTLRETLTHWAMSWGDGYAEIHRNQRGDPIGLYPIHPSRVWVHRLVGGEIVYDVRADFLAGGADWQGIRLRPDEVLHIHGLGDGICGFSVLRLAAESLGLALAAQTFGAAFFGNGASMSGVLTHPGKLEDTARANLRQSWRTMYGGAKNAGNTAILEEGMTYSRIGVPPEEAQFLETRQFQVEDICRWFRMPPHKVQSLLRSTFSNIESQNLEYVVDTLLAWIARWEQEIARKLVPPGSDLVVEIVVAGLLRGDQAARANFYRTMVNIGAMTPNEVREIENMNQGGEALDRSYMQSNMMPLEAIGTQTARPGPAAIAETAPPADAGTDPAETDRAHLNAQVAMMQPVLIEACNRVLNREASAAIGAAKRYAGNAAHLKRWADAFYAEQATYLVDALAPAVRALEGLVGAPPVNLDDFAREHAGRSRDACLASAGAALHDGNTAGALADEIVALILARLPEPTHAA